MFYGCKLFNQSIKIPDNAIDCYIMLAGCESLDKQNVTIPDRLSDYKYLFKDNIPLMIIGIDIFNLLR